MFGIFRRYSVSIILNEGWVTLRPVIKVKHVPRSGEVIYFEDTDEYYKVLSVIHNINKNHGVFIIVEKMEKSPQDTET